jgi:hypothetical protein
MSSTTWKKEGVNTGYDYSQQTIWDLNSLQDDLHKQIEDLKLKNGEMSDNVNGGKEGDTEGNQKERRKCNKYDKVIAAASGCFISMVHMYWFLNYIACRYVGM